MTGCASSGGMSGFGKLPEFWLRVAHPSSCSDRTFPKMYDVGFREKTLRVQVPNKYILT